MKTKRLIDVGPISAIAGKRIKIDVIGHAALMFVGTDYEADGKGAGELLAMHWGGAGDSAEPGKRGIGAPRNSRSHLMTCGDPCN